MEDRRQEVVAIDPARVRVAMHPRVEVIEKWDRLQVDGDHPVRADEAVETSRPDRTVVDTRRDDDYVYGVVVREEVRVVGLLTERSDCLLGQTEHGCHMIHEAISGD